MSEAESAIAATVGAFTMFRNRTNSQKPTDQLLNTFKASYPQLGSDGSPTSASMSHSALTDALDVAHHSRHYVDSHHHHDLKDEPTPKGANEPWSFGTGLTPSVLDPDSHSFNAFANQLPGYYTPTPGGTNTLYHSQHAGDLHTPGFHMGLGTPLSMPTSEGGMQQGQQALSMHAFNSQPQTYPIHQQEFQNMNPFQMHTQPGFPPQNYQSQPPSLQHMESGSTDSPSLADFNMDMGIRSHSSEMLFHPEAFHNAQNQSAAPLQHPLMEKFRYHVTLNAPTAMVKNADEIPITYLNKGQTYSLNVRDTAPQHSSVGQLKYRTFVRVSFEDDEQRRRPGACWQLWKEGRGTNEAHHRGGRLQAVEYVDPTQASEIPTKASMDLEYASFDGFCVTWSPGSNGAIECPIPVRFNFLSTDFSHSKGVKGIPVRLCAKTELLLDTMSPSGTNPAHEVAYCKVKLFRDHGAERKLSNDVAHVKKSIDKLNQQLTQIESGMRDLGKRKRSGGGNDSQRPGKVPKHRRTWSMSSANSGGKNSAEEDLQIKLMNLQDMFSSTRTTSILFLRGDTADDPDAHPVRLSGESADAPKVEPIDTSVWEKRSVQSSVMVSPTPSNQSIMSGGRRRSSFQNLGAASRVTPNEWKSQQQTAITDLKASNPQHLASPPDQSVKVQTHSPTSGTLSGWIETLGVDSSYQPPPERAIKPVACFYVQPRVAGHLPADNLYRAIYLMQRSLKDFTTTLAMRCNIEPTSVMRTVHVTRKGLSVLFDDEAVAELPEGQDMTAEFHPMVAPDSPVKPMREWNAGADDIQVDGELSTVFDKPSRGYELRLLF